MGPKTVSSQIKAEVFFPIRFPEFFLDFQFLIKGCWHIIVFQSHNHIAQKISHSEAKPIQKDAKTD